MTTAPMTPTRQLDVFPADPHTSEEGDHAGDAVAVGADRYRPKGAGLFWSNASTGAG